MKRSILASGLVWLWLSVLVVGIDLMVKQSVMIRFTLGESMPLLPFFSFTYAHNPGAAFSFLADQEGWQRWFFAIIALLVCVVLLFMMYKGKRQERLNNSAYALIIGGALGNLFDRLVHGVVIDFLHFHLGSWSFPIFNLADVAICMGAVLILLEGFLTPSAKKGEQSDSAGRS